MTHDPWSMHAALSCPSCHVVGKVVRFEREDGGHDCCDDERLDDVDPYTCCECGQTWADTGQVGDVKEYRVAYSRLVEGRPYEPPKPKEPVKSKVDISAFDGMLKGLYGPEWFEERIVQLAALKCTQPGYNGRFAMPDDAMAVPEFVTLNEANASAVYVKCAPMPDGEWRTTKVDKETGTITVEFIKK